MATKQYNITWTFWMAFLLQVIDVCGNITAAITSNADEFEMGRVKSLTCFITTVNVNDRGKFPLKWTKKSAPEHIIDATETTKDEGGNLKLYTSSITFTVTKYMNGDAFICTSSFGAETEYATKHVIVYRRPDAPITRGPSVVRCGQTAVWTCIADCSSFLTRVVWVNRHGDGKHFKKQNWLSTVTGDWANEDKYINEQSVYTWYTVENNLTLTVGQRETDFSLYCFVSRSPHENGELGKAEVRVAVRGGSCAG